MPACGDLCVTTWGKEMGLRRGSLGLGSGWLSGRCLFCFEVLLAGAWKFSASGSKRDGLAQIESDAKQVKLGGVGCEAHIARSGPAIAALPGAECALDGLPDRDDQGIAPRPPESQPRLMFVRPVHDAVLDPALLEPGAALLLLIGAVGIDRPFIAAHERVRRLALVDFGGCQQRAADQPRAEIDPDMGFVAKH